MWIPCSRIVGDMEAVKDAVRYVGTPQLVHVCLVYRAAKGCMIDAVALVQHCLFVRGSVILPEVDGSTMVRSDATSVKSQEAVIAGVLEVTIRRDVYQIRRCLVCLRRRANGGRCSDQGGN